MSVEQFTNNAQTTLNGAITNSQTTITVNSNAGFPSVAQFRIIIDSEIMLVTGGANTTTWTVTRGNNLAAPDTTTNTTHGNTATVTHILTAGGLTNYTLNPTSYANWASNSLVLTPAASNWGLFVQGPSNAGNSYGIFSSAGTNSNDYAARFQTQAAVDILAARGDGVVVVGGTPGTIRMTGTGTATVIGGTTGFQVQNNAGNVANLTFPDNGQAVFRNGLALLGGTKDVGAGTIGYAQVTASQGSITAQTDLTGLTLTFTAVAGRRYRVSSYVDFSNTNVDVASELFLMDTSGPTQIVRGDTVHPVAGGFMSITLQAILVPGAVTKTYKLQAAATGGTTTLQASATSPAFLMIEDIGT